MAIQDTNTNAPTAAAPAQEAQQQTSQGFSWGMLSNNSLTGITRAATSESLIKTKEALLEFYKQMRVPTGLEITVLPIDRSKETNLYLSSVAVCASFGKQSAVTYHILMLENSNEPLAPKIENFNGQQIQIDRLTSDVFNNEYQRTAHDVVSRSFPGRELEPCSAQYIPRGFNLEDKNALHQLAMNALIPTTSALEAGMKGFVDVNLAQYNRDAKLTVNVTFNEHDRTDYAGLPVRDSVSVKVIASNNVKANPHEINTADKQLTVSELGGFIDLMWAPTEVAQNMYSPVQVPQQKFAARFVMTNLENQLKMTIPSQLLALVSAMSLREGTNWYPYFAPRAGALAGGKKSVDLRDIGAINIEANIFNETAHGQYGTRVDTKAASFTNMELGKLVASAIRPGLVYSLDVSECGADTWYNEVFIAAAAGNTGAQQAVVDAANTLTGGHFARHFQANAGAVFVNEDRIHLGYYVNADGQKRDIREIDYLAVMNLLGDKDPGAGEAWSQTFLNLNYPLAQRLDARRKMIQDLVRGEVQFTGFARRVTFTAEFLNALVAGCRDAGLELQIHSASFGVNYQSQRSVFGLANQAAMAPNSSGMFTSGFAGMVNNNAYGQFGNRQYRSW